MIKVFKKSICIECGHDKPRIKRAPVYRTSDICSWQCDVAHHRKEQMAICLTDKYIASSAQHLGDKFWQTDTLLFELCSRFSSHVELAADQWWGITVDGWWAYGPDMPYEFDEADASPFAKIEGYLLGDDQTIGHRRYQIHSEPDVLNDGLIRVLAMCVTKTQEMTTECEAWEKAHIDGLREAFKAEYDHRLATWPNNILDLAEREYKDHLKRLDSYQ